MLLWNLAVTRPGERVVRLWVKLWVKLGRPGDTPKWWTYGPWLAMWPELISAKRARVATRKKKSAVARNKFEWNGLG